MAEVNTTSLSTVSNHAHTAARPKTAQKTAKTIIINARQTKYFTNYWREFYCSLQMMKAKGREQRNQIAT